MRVLLGQTEPLAGDVRRNVEAIATAVASRAGADLAVFPELALCGYDVDGLPACAIDAADPVLEPLRDAAAGAGCAIVAGFPERHRGGTASSALCVDRAGRIAGVARKTHLFGPERHALVAGEELAPVEVDGVPVGVMVCFDLEFPEVARTLAAAGAELLVTVAANMDPFGPDHAVFAAARALESGLPHVYVNRVGTEAGLRFCGGSAVHDAGGERLALAGATAAQVELDVPLAPRADRRLRYLEQLRPALYDLGGARERTNGALRPAAVASRPPSTTKEEE